MDRFTAQMHAFMQAYIDCLNSEYDGLIFPNTGTHRIITSRGSDIQVSRYVSITHDNRAYVRSDGAIFYKRPDLMLQEIPSRRDDSYLIVFDDQALLMFPFLQDYQRLPTIDLINYCYKDVEELMEIEHGINILYSFEDLYGIFLDFGFDETEEPENIYAANVDAMDYNLSYFPLPHKVGVYQ